MHSSLTPRETSKGLRRPGRQNGVDAARMSYQESRRSSTYNGDPDDEDGPPPTEGVLRDRMRALRDRRGRPDVNGLADGGVRLDIAIRSRTNLTLQSARKKDASSADLDAAREAELARQRVVATEVRGDDVAPRAASTKQTESYPLNMTRREKPARARAPFPRAAPIA